MDIAIFTFILILVIGYAIYALVKGGHKSASGSATTMLGATDLMRNEDKKRAAQEIVQQRAGEIRHISEDDQGEVSKDEAER